MSRLGDYYAQIKDCSRCRLYSSRTNLVFGDGNENADLVFIGEAPGFHEDQQGKPFVGAAGKLLTQLLEEIGLKREDVYITNIIKSRPPNNRDPLPDEIEACKPYLMEQLKIINPKIIATLGAHAARTMLDRNVSMTAVHGQVFKQDGYILIPIFHPAAALYRRPTLEQLREDFKKLKNILEKPKEVDPPQVSTKQDEGPEAQQGSLF